MRSKNSELMNNIVEFINREYFDSGRTPTMQEIATAFGISKGCVSNYIAEMHEKGMLENSGTCRGVRTKKMEKLQQAVEYLPVVGSIACGTPMLAEENIETYLPISTEFLGAGSYFILKAYGESMINAGIDDGDLVVVRQQETAEEGQIVVALIDNETTLKRYYLDEKRKRIRLHPENDGMDDMYFKSIDIQGVAIKVIKDLF